MVKERIKSDVLSKRYFVKKNCFLHFKEVILRYKENSQYLDSAELSVPSGKQCRKHVDYSLAGQKN